MSKDRLTLDAGRAWADAMATLKGQREIALTLAGVFLMLPMLTLLMLRWPDMAQADAARAVARWDAWSSANSHWLLLVALFGAFGRAVLLVLLFDRARPTVSAALGAAARLFLMFYLTALLASLVPSVALLLSALPMPGFFLFVLPGLYLMGRLFLAEQVAIAERERNPLRAVARSMALTRGNGWRLFGVQALIALGALIFMLAVSTVFGVLGIVLGGQALAQFFTAFTVSIVFAGVYLVLLLVGAAAYAQLAQELRAA